MRMRTGRYLSCLKSACLTGVGPTPDRRLTDRRLTGTSGKGEGARHLTPPGADNRPSDQRSDRHDS